jgi:hypothetical protein
VSRDIARLGDPLITKINTGLIYFEDDNGTGANLAPLLAERPPGLEDNRCPARGLAPTYPRISNDKSEIIHRASCRAKKVQKRLSVYIGDMGQFKST